MMNSTFEMPVYSVREMLISTYSDTYKDAHGIRPRWINFDNMSDMDIQAGIDSNCEEASINARHEAIFAEKKVVEFKELIERTIEMGANDEATALRWIADAENTEFIHMQNIESIVWNYGILFTDYGRNIVEKIAKVVTFVD